MTVLARCVGDRSLEVLILLILLISLQGRVLYPSHNSYCSCFLGLHYNRRLNKLFFFLVDFIEKEQEGAESPNFCSSQGFHFLASVYTWSLLNPVSILLNIVQLYFIQMIWCSCRMSPCRQKFLRRFWAKVNL